MIPFVALCFVLAQAPLPPGTTSPLPPNHPPLDSAPPAGRQAAAPDGDELLKRLEAAGDLKTREKTFEIAASLGKLYFSHGRHADAVVFLEQAVTKAEPARALYLAKKKALGTKPIPTPAAAGCVPGPAETMESQLAKAKAQKDPAFAAACARAALHPLIELESQLGGAKFLTNDPAGAIAVYDRALLLFDSNPEARYGRGAALLDSKGEDPAALKLAKADLERFLADYPTSPRAKQARLFASRVDAAIAAGGVSKVKAAPKEPKVDPHAPPKGAQPPALTPEMIEAFKNVERTPELAANFAKLLDQGEEHLARGRFQEALDSYKQVMPYDPENPRVRSGIAWAMLKLNKQPMADNVWKVATQSPDGIVALGDALQRKGDPEQAKAVWKKLVESVPSYAGRLNGKL